MMKPLIVLSTLTILLLGDGLLEVAWPKNTLLYQKQQKHYPLALKRAIKDITLPLYLPQSYLEDKSLFLVSDANFYTATVTLEGAVLTITGDRTYQQKIKTKNKILKKRIEDKKVTFNHAEGLMMTDFNRHNINYTLSIECEDPQKDQRCTQEGFLRRVYKELVMVGGKR
jgi:hypothetical protein